MNRRPRPGEAALAKRTAGEDCSALITRYSGTGALWYVGVRRAAPGESEREIQSRLCTEYIDIYSDPTEACEDSTAAIAAMLTHRTERLTTIPPPNAASPRARQTLAMRSRKNAPEADAHDGTEKQDGKDRADRQETQDAQDKKPAPPRKPCGTIKKEERDKMKTTRETNETKMISETDAIKTAPETRHAQTAPETDAASKTRKDCAAGQSAAKTAHGTGGTQTARKEGQTPKPREDQKASMTRTACKTPMTRDTFAPRPPPMRARTRTHKRARTLTQTSANA